MERDRSLIPLCRHTTPFPDVLLDQVMPKLKDTEWRILCVIVRQTLGWQVGSDPRVRKQRDWLTQSQLQRRTGRRSEAISRAVERLVDAGLIVVQDERGRPLPSPEERRREFGRLYYRLAAEVLQSCGEEPGSGKSEAAKAKRTRNTDYKIEPGNLQNGDKAVDNCPSPRCGHWTRPQYPQHRKASS